jgi:CheY-like chemotaxis protein
MVTRSPHPLNDNDSPRNARLHILVVDDEATVRDIIREHLETEGHFVDVASDGEAGLESFKKGGWDLVLTDRVMPKLSGDGLAQAIKKLKPETPVILVTAFAERPPDPNDPYSPFDLVIRKPFTHETLRAAIGAVVH